MSQMNADKTDRDNVLDRCEDPSSLKYIGSLFLICLHLRHLRTMSSLHPGPDNHALTDIRQSPLMGELPAVLLEQSFGVDAVALERGAAEVVDEQIISHGQLETGPACALGRVVVEQPWPELLTLASSPRVPTQMQPQENQ